MCNKKSNTKASRVLSSSACSNLACQEKSKA